MAVNPDLKFCLTWETERPYLDRIRQSSCFRMLGEDCYLTMSLGTVQCDNKICCCSVRLYRRNGENLFESEIKVKCFVIADQLLYDSSSLYTVHKSGDEIFGFRMPRNSSPLEYSSEWKLICHFSCAKPLLLQINNETIHMSTVKNVDSPPISIDRCVQVSPEIPLDIETLCCDFSSLLVDEIFPDFQLKCGERSFQVHRSILSARSEVFRTMAQKSETTADIQDLEVPVIESLLKFIYSGRLEQVSEDTICGLYKAGDKYAVHSLKSACSCWMKRNLTEENCVSFLDTADSFSDHDLRAAVVSFIIKHPTVLKTTAWLTFSKQHQELAIEVLQTCISSS